MEDRPSALRMRTTNRHTVNFDPLSTHRVCPSREEAADEVKFNWFQRISYVSMSGLIYFKE